MNASLSLWPPDFFVSGGPAEGPEQRRFDKVVPPYFLFGCSTTNIQFDSRWVCLALPLRGAGHFYRYRLLPTSFALKYDESPGRHYLRH